MPTIEYVRSEIERMRSQVGTARKPFALIRMFGRKELLPLQLVLAVIIAGLIVKQGKLHRRRLTAESAVGMLE